MLGRERLLANAGARLWSLSRQNALSDFLCGAVGLICKPDQPCSFFRIAGFGSFSAKPLSSGNLLDDAIVFSVFGALASLFTVNCAVEAPKSYQQDHDQNRNKEQTHSRDHAQFRFGLKCSAAILEYQQPISDHFNDFCHEGRVLAQDCRNPLWSSRPHWGPSRWNRLLPS